MAICGIDLGTTNSLISVIEGGKPKLIPNVLGAFLTPSCVGLDEEGNVLTGQAAKERLITHPDITVSSFKRLMGSPVTTALGKFNFRPEELSQFILKALKADAEAVLGEPVEEVVISVPAYFNDPQRKATLDAGKLAGLNVNRLVNEPTAAALAYGLGDLPEGKYLIFDLGGGTFDVSILHKYEDVMEIRATTGDSMLGGDDFDTVIETMIAEKGGFDPEKLSPHDRARLTRAAETLKLSLSAAHEVPYVLSLGGRKQEGLLTREAFEAECAGLIRRLRRPLELALADAKLDPNSFDAVVLAGGATRAPMVRALVARLFGRLPLSHIDPDTIVALGAAAQAGLIKRQGDLKDIVMTDVCPFTLGIQAVDMSNPTDPNAFVAPIIQRNAVIPISRSIKLATAQDNQPNILVQVYQGENLRPEDNIHLGSLKFDLPRQPKGKEYIEVRFTYDISGALEVEVFVPSTGSRESRIFRNASGLTLHELEASFRALSAIKLHPRERMENKTLLTRAHRIYAEQTQDNRHALRRHILQFEANIASQTLRDASEIRVEFSRLLDRFESSIFG